MFESLMFWKKKEESSNSVPPSTSLPNLDLPNAPNFNAQAAEFGAPNGAGNFDSRSFSQGYDTNAGMPSYGDGMSQNSQSAMAMNMYSTSQGQTGGNSMNGMVDPYANPMQSAPTGFGQSTYPNPAAMMSQTQLQNAAVPTNPMTVLPNRSMPNDPNQIHPRDVELILSRLELIRAEIENVNHRLSYLEQAQLPNKNVPGQKGKNWY